MPERAGSWEAPSSQSIRALNRSPWDIVVWGRNDFAQIGTSPGDASVSVQHTPVLAPALQDKRLAFLAGSQLHTAYVTADGEVFMCGNNESAQLATRPQPSSNDGACCLRTPTRAAALEAHTVDAVACGADYTVAVTQQGAVMGWGTGDWGQIGAPAVTQQSIPRRIRGLEGVRIERVATGVAHTLALSQRYQVYSFGANMHGALGLGDTDNRDAPAQVQTLWGVGIVAIDAGDYHSAALAADGRLFTWGRGKFGTLGHGDTENRLAPRDVQGLAHTPLAAFAAGGAHTVALSVRRRVYAWGHNDKGQLGLGHFEDGLIPVVLADSGSWRIAQVSAGAEHTLLRCSDGTLYGCGASDSGQLAMRCADSQPLPRHLDIPGRAAFALACGDHCVAACGSAAALATTPHATSPLTCSSPIAIPDPLALAKAARPDASEPAERGARVRALIAALQGIFGCPGLLLAGFTLPARPGDDASPSPQRHGLDVDAVAEVYEAVLLVLESDVVVKLREAIVGLLEELEAAATASTHSDAAVALWQAQWVKVLVIFLLNPINSDGRSGAWQLPAALARVVFVLRPKVRKLLTQWLSQLPADVLGGRAVRPLQRHLSTHVESNGWTKSRSHVLLVGSLLHVLDDANKLAGCPVPYTQLANAAVSQAVMQSLQVEWMAWQREKQSVLARGAAGAELPQSLCQLPFLMTPECKKVIMQGEAMLMQNHEVQNSLDRAMALMQRGTVLIGPHISQIGCLHIQVRRSHILEDAMQQLMMHFDDLRKPLKVTFLGGDRGDIREEAVDEGGVSKEFFQLLVRAIFSADYGMFEYVEETREHWFSPAALAMGASELDFKMVGVVLGLAIFNAIILDVHLPLVTYKKLLNGTPTFGDLEDAQPSLARGLKALRDYQGDDLEVVFCRTFEVEYRVFDQVSTHELVPDGSERPVTQHNKQEFIDACVAWHLSESVAGPFAAFKEGFYSVASGSALVLFNHHELELLVCGLPHLDFHALEKAAVYEGGYSAEHPTVRRFWRLLHAMSLEQKKRFLAFVTGCDRAPMGGLGKLRMLIQRAGDDSERLPTSHTCFNVLLLPDYATDAKMQRMLLTAVENAEGFGLQ